MIDLFHLAQGTSFDPDVAVFQPRQYTGATTGWQVWSKPRGKSILCMYLISGGAGGGGGASADAGGGGAGGSSGFSRYIYPMFAIPDNFYVLVGHGGRGGAADTPGDSGQLSYVGVYPNIAANNLFGISGNAAPSSGGGGTGTGGAGGSGGTAASLANAPLSCWSIAAYSGGLNGQSGGTGAADGSSVAVTGAARISPGTAGAGNLGAGGGYVALANSLFEARPGAPIGVRGNPGQFLQDRVYVYGGAGGGGSSDGGNCGPDAFGGGGGGGGGGAGRGGNGGPGLVILASY